jgi:hypothetical protein
MSPLFADSLGDSSDGSKVTTGASLRICAKDGSTRGPRSVPWRPVGAPSTATNPSLTRAPCSLVWPLGCGGHGRVERKPPLRSEHPQPTRQTGSQERLRGNRYRTGVTIASAEDVVALLAGCAGKGRISWRGWRSAPVTVSALRAAEVGCTAAARQDCLGTRFCSTRLSRRL